MSAFKLYQRESQLKLVSDGSRDYNNTDTPHSGSDEEEENQMAPDEEIPFDTAHYPASPTSDSASPSHLQDSKANQSSGISYANHTATGSAPNIDKWQVGIVGGMPLEDGISGASRGAHEPSASSRMTRPPTIDSIFLPAEPFGRHVSQWTRSVKQSVSDWMHRKREKRLLQHGDSQDPFGLS